MKRLGIFKDLSPQTPDTVEPADRWQRQAECAQPGYDPEVWFPTGEGPAAQQQTADAKAVCYRCPVIDVCLRAAMDNGQREGVWGGLTELERQALSRRRRRAAAAGPSMVTVTEPAPPPQPQIRTKLLRTVRQAYDAMSDTADADGHITWTGPNSITIGREYYSPNQLAWRITHTPPPIGSITRTCNVPKCVAHLADQPMRDELKARKRKPGRKPAECGTPGGYAAHRRRGEVACRGCKNANADADRRLRNTGTTKPADGAARPRSSSGRDPIFYKPRKVTPAQADEIRALSIDGASLQDLALKYGVSTNTIRNYAA